MNLLWSVVVLPVLVLPGVGSCYSSFAGEGDGWDVGGEDRGADLHTPEDAVTPSDGREAPDCSACSPSPDAGDPPAACPPECTGGCDGRVCVIDCNRDSSCQLDLLACPPGMDCRVECGRGGSCGSSTILLPSDGAGQVVCEGMSSCQGLEIHCPPLHPCQVVCVGQSSCQGFNLWCGEGPCDLYCDPGTGGHSPCIRCDGSCCCTTNCPSYPYVCD